MRSIYHNRPSEGSLGHIAKVISTSQSQTPILHITSYIPHNPFIPQIQQSRNHNILQSMWGLIVIYYFITGKGQKELTKKDHEKTNGWASTFLSPLRNQVVTSDWSSQLIRKLTSKVTWQYGWWHGRGHVSPNFNVFRDDIGPFPSAMCQHSQGDTWQWWRHPTD